MRVVPTQSTTLPCPASTWRVRAVAVGLLSGALLNPAAASAQAGSANCGSDLVPRNAFPGDGVCVTLQVHDQAIADNVLAPSRTNPDGSCVEGYVWREANPSDHVCVLPETRALERDELEMTQGYFVPQTAEAITIKFLPHFEGYIWSFPRNDHLSVGICGSMSSHTSTELRSHLQTFVEKHEIPTEGAKFYSHVLPSPQERTLSDRNVIGKNWALIGDAAAMVDPLTGEGLFYAIRSGELLGRSLAEGCPEKYPAWVKAAFSAELEFAARIVRRFYRGSFLGSAVTTRMVQFMRRSPVFRQLVGDLFSGTQDYTSLKKRLWGHLGITISEFISSVLNLERAAAARVPRVGTSGAERSC